MLNYSLSATLKKIQKKSYLTSYSYTIDIEKKIERKGRCEIQS